MGRAWPNSVRTQPTQGALGSPGDPHTAPPLPAEHTSVPGPLHPSIAEAGMERACSGPRITPRPHGATALSISTAGQGAGGRSPTDTPTSTVGERGRGLGLKLELRHNHDPILQARTRRSSSISPPATGRSRVPQGRMALPGLPSPTRPPPWSLGTETQTHDPWGGGGHGDAALGRGAGSDRLTGAARWPPGQSGTERSRANSLWALVWRLAPIHGL